MILPHEHYMDDLIIWRSACWPAGKESAAAVAELAAAAANCAAMITVQMKRLENERKKVAVTIIWR
jgi:hypothetical protein